jgi:phosphopantothenoylcysteine decarboxylase / phosphopantothenate---cysteine ligase
MSGLEALNGRTIALVVTGSIAAYKSVEVARRCLAAGAKVLPVMTRSAERFLGAVTLAGITGEPVAIDMWDPSFRGEMHVALAERADVVAIVPGTADLLARLAGGRADDLVTALALCARCPIVVAPAMHPRMWSHPATVANLATLAEHGRVTLIGPVDGPVASGDSGLGRMSEPSDIVLAIARALDGRAPPAKQDFAGRRVLVTAGPTVEDLDPVRFLGNRSTGKMGFAIAERAARRGAEVTLIAGPVSLATPPGVRRIDVRSALEMKAAIWTVAGEALAGIDLLVMSAAVADHRPATTSASKMKKEGDAASIALVRNPDLLAEVGTARGGAARPVLVGFAVETGTDEEVVAYAKGKLAKKRVDLVVANAAQDAFAGDLNRATIVTRSGAAHALPRMTKTDLADAILDATVELK